MTATARCDRVVLVVEDDGSVRESIVEVLEDQDYTCVGATNGAEALARLSEPGFLPCVILLDLMMPVMDGQEFRRRQQAEPQLADVPVVVLSAHQNGGEIAAALQADAHIRKPVTLPHLLEVVTRFCGRPGGERPHA